ncbi:MULTISPECIES: HAD family hydrolase [Streptomyces]|uniref:HAD hydrolase-like protein n=1 Tax=Streptomyces changanensis TaxID=2964669 RepID=A0ABY5N815_9ACTN|nr:MULTISPECIES: HAD family hydrolase [Streptomyces]UUS32201.1 HAD hydrolase-like protein [Streptomyces changanensis]
MGTDVLAKIMDAAQGLLVDFDGPVCDVFGGRSAAVAERLVEVVARRDPALAAELAGVGDPVEVVRRVHAEDAGLGCEVEEALTAAEVAAVEVAGDPTPGAVAVLEGARDAGRRIAVVGDTSAACMRAFLDRHGLSSYVLHVVGRPERQPELTKPNPYPLITAAEQLGLDVTLCALIGDSVTDVRAAHAVGAVAVGYADGPDRRQALVDAGAEAVVGEMRVIAEAMPAPSD